MKTHELYNLLGEIDSEYISDACPRYANKEEPNTKRNVRKKIIYGTLSFAACMALIITAVIGNFTPTVKARSWQPSPLTLIQALR